ncbi:AraC family transcriptional regulator ligand-binding domain-containing protein [Streptomyces sp. NPDC059168]|uniref:AraC family transcriptional regulator ligand-binding domain-containing protein n=1 Tax=Streptomyces sp. NPDC059168 TaxID=3346753 RepID=UPI003697152D
MTIQGFTVQPTVRALLADLGINGDHVLRRAGLPADLFTRGSIALPPEDYFALWLAVEEESGDPELPLTVVRSLSAEVFDPAIFAALCSQDLSAAARRIGTYKRLIGPMALRVRETPEGLEVAYQWPAGVMPPPVLAVTEVSFWVVLARIATRHEVRPRRVTTPEPPANPAPYREFLGVEIERGRRQEIVFHADDAQRPFLTADRRMWDFFEPELRRRLSELQVGCSVAERVRAALLELLPAGNFAMAAVARHLGVSPRTLQRHLRDDGVTYQDVLSATRESLARHYLRNSAMSVRDIAYLLGYEDPNSFYRAFHSWTGLTPSQVSAGR